MSDDDGICHPPLTPARLRAMAEWFREFAAMAPVEQQYWKLDLAATYERLAVDREVEALSTEFRLVALTG